MSEMKKNYEKWMKHLSSEGRLANLKEKTPSQLAKEFGLTTEFFQQEKERLLDRPSQTGEKRSFTLKATPKKKIILNKADVCEPHQAITEILDNIFDNFEEQGKKDLSVTIRFFLYEGADEVRITENSGGIEKAKLEPLVRLGDPQHNVESGIGTWGEGFKIAAAALGRDVQVYTHFPGQDSVVVKMDPSWWDSDDWEVPVFNADVPEGTTTIAINQLQVSQEQIDVDEIVHHIEMTYSRKLRMYLEQGKSIEISVGVSGRETRVVKVEDTTSLEALKKKFTFHPVFPPIRVRYEWKRGNRELRATFIVGLTPRGEPQTSGVTMYGNGRRFESAKADRDVGFGEPGGGSLPRQNPTMTRLHLYVFFEAQDPQDIPWQAPLKDGYNAKHVFVPDIKEAVKRLGRPYVAFARVAENHDTEPFSYVWDEYGQAKKLEILFPSIPEKERKVRATETSIKTILDSSPNYHIQTYVWPTDQDEIPVLDTDKTRPFVRMVDARNKNQLDVSDEEYLEVLFPWAFTPGDTSGKAVPVEPSVTGPVIDESTMGTQMQQEKNSPPPDPEPPTGTGEATNNAEDSGQSSGGGIAPATPAAAPGVDYVQLSSLLEKKAPPEKVTVKVQITVEDLQALKKYFGSGSREAILSKAYRYALKRMEEQADDEEVPSDGAAE